MNDSTTTTNNLTPTPALNQGDAMSGLKVTVIDNSREITKTTIDANEGRTGVLATVRRGAFAADGKLQPGDTVDIVGPSGALMRGVPLRQAARLGLVKEDPNLGFVNADAPPQGHEQPTEGAPNEAPNDASADLPEDHADHRMNRAETFSTAEGMAALDHIAKTTGDLMSATAVYLGSGSVPPGVDPAAVDVARREVEGILGAAIRDAGVPKGQVEAFWDDLGNQPGGKQKATRAVLTVMASGDLRPIKSLAREFARARNFGSASTERGDRVKVQLPSGRTIEATAANAARLGLPVIQ